MLLFFTISIVKQNKQSSRYLKYLCRFSLVTNVAIGSDKIFQEYLSFLALYSANLLFNSIAIVKFLAATNFHNFIYFSELQQCVSVDFPHLLTVKKKGGGIETVKN